MMRWKGAIVLQPTPTETAVRDNSHLVQRVVFLQAYSVIAQSMEQEEM